MICHFTESHFFKSMAIFLAILLAFQCEGLLAQANDPALEAWSKAKAAFGAGDFVASKDLLEPLLAQLEGIEGRDSLKGEASLLLGAAFEKLQQKEKAVANYCLAKKLLGEGKSFEGLDLATLPFYQEPCPPPTSPAPAPAPAPMPVVQPVPAVVPVPPIDPIEGQFNKAKEAFFSNNYETAKGILEKLIGTVAAIQGRDTLKGEIYLLSGATYEKLKYKELSVKYFCLAKQTLGKDKSFEPLKLKDYKYYKENCQTGYAKAKKKGGFGRFLSTLLILAILAVGGYFLYTKVIKKATEEEEETNTQPIVYETNYEAFNCWFLSASSGSSTPPTITPSSDWAPFPRYGNSYDDTKTVSITGPIITSYKVTLTITACKGLTRHDQVWVNDVLIQDVTNKFDRTCGRTLDDFCNNPGADGKEYLITQGSGEVTLKIRHKIAFTLPANAAQEVIVMRDIQTVLKRADK